LVAEPPNVRLNLSNRAENVSLVREMLTGVAETLALEGPLLNDITTAVTEACNNVVVHAYEGGEGPLEIELYASSGPIEIVVRDHGTGIQPRIRPENGVASGIGLLVIQALVDSVEFKGAVPGSAETGGPHGTEVRMTFAASATGALEPCEQSGSGAPGVGLAEQASLVSILISPTRLARTVLPRLLTALAARAGFSTDRISDAQLVGDSLAAQAPTSLSADQLSLGVRVRRRDLELSLSPLRRGGARDLILDGAAEGVGPVIEKLTESQDVKAAGASEVLVLRLAERP